MRRAFVCFVSLVLGGAAPAGTAGAQGGGASLRMLPPQPAPRPYTAITRVSDDGRVVAGILHDLACVAGGSCFARNPQAFRQADGGPLEPLPFLTPAGTFPESSPSAITGDGAVLYGQSTLGLGRDGCVWTAGGVAPLGTGAAPRAVSSDGTVLLLADGGLLRDGAVTPPPRPTSETIFGARALSRDGSILAGAVFGDPALEGAAIFRDGVVTWLPDPPGLSRGEAQALSDDGRVVVGVARDATGVPHAVVWTDGVPQRIVDDGFYAASGGPWGGPPLWGSSEAVDVSGDGRLVLVALGSGPPLAIATSAFLWDQANGLRRLGDVLRSDFRVDTSAWQEGPAASITGDGRVIVGAGQGFARSGWVVTLADGCMNGVDDDGDGTADLADPGCADAADYSERGPGPECDDGLDNDFDGVFDFPAEPSCASPAQAVEGDCTDALDNDLDGLVDAEDPGCLGPDDHDERHPMLPCDDGVDNDGDGAIDYFGGWGDSSCASGAWPAESTPCSDDLDNDGDGLFDHWEDPGCGGQAWDLSEADGATCGLGAELLPVVAGLLALRRAGRRSGTGRG